MDSTTAGRLLAREAEARLDARIRRMSLLWWAAAYVILCLLNFTTEAPQGWPTDLAGYAGGCAAGVACAALAARHLARLRRRRGREAFRTGLVLALASACVCGLVAGALSGWMVGVIGIKAPVIADFPVLIAYYMELCLGWYFIQLTIIGADRLVWMQSEVARLRIILMRSQDTEVRDLFRPYLLGGVFAGLNAALAARRREEAQAVVLAIADRLRGALAQLKRADAAAEELQIAPGDGDVSSVVLRFVLRPTIANAILWLFIFVIFVAAIEPYLLSGWRLQGAWKFIIYWSSFCIAGYGGCFVLERMSRALNGRSLPLKSVMAVLFTIIGAYTTTWLPSIVWALLGHGHFKAANIFMFGFYYCFSYAVWYCLYFYTQAVRREMAQRALLAQTAEAAAAARNSMLRYQVRPHFLFNALNALYTLIVDAHWAAARDMSEALRAYVERSFAEDERDFVPVAEQAEALSAYLRIETVRFGPRLRFRAEIAAEVAAALAPALILHPLIENAMKYAVATSAEPVDIELDARREGGELVLAVRDSGGDPDASPDPGLGIGLKNVSARLAGHYGAGGALQCKPLAPKGFVAEIRLPLEFACKPYAVSPSSAADRLAAGVRRSGSPGAALVRGALHD